MRKDRPFRALVRKTFGGSGRAGTLMAKSSFIASLVFVFALVCALSNYMMTRWIRQWERYEGYHNAVIVNCPESLGHFFNASDENRYFRIFSRLEEDDAYYDIGYFSDLMHEHEAFITIVFPTDFDEQIKNGDTPDVLTIYLTDKLKYSDWRKVVIDEPIYFYGNYLKELYGIPYSEEHAINIVEQAVKTSAGRTDMEVFMDTMATTTIPIVFVIAILYVAMSSGTNAISGEKERSTFTSIILSPISRFKIVTGHLTGVFMNSMIAPLIMMVIVMCFPRYRSLTGFIYTIMLLISLAVFISAITIMISIMNDSIVAAQTAFIPVFFILISVCVTCMQNSEDADRYLLWFPVYGHFYGIGAALTGRDRSYGEPIAFIDVFLCVIITLILTFIVIKVSEKLLCNERFTVTVESVSDKRARKDLKTARKMERIFEAGTRNSIYGYEPLIKERKKTHSNFILGQILFPLVLISFFQLLAIIPAAFRFTGSSEFSGVLQSLKDIRTIPEVIEATFNILALFMKDNVFIILFGLSYVLIIAVYVLRNNVRDKNGISALGFTHREGSSALKEYLLGLVLGILMISSVYLILILSGQIVTRGFIISSESFVAIMIGLFMWIPQGACEEVMFRGYMMSRTAARFGTVFAVCFSSLLFSVFHSGNVGFSILAFVNLFLIALLFAMISLWRNGIWMTCAAHTIWNFSQGSIYGLRVSGNTPAASLLSTSYTRSASDVITGGDFGPEGGLAVTAVTVILLIAVFILLGKSKNGSAERTALPQRG